MRHSTRRKIRTRCNQENFKKLIFAQVGEKILFRVDCTLLINRAIIEVDNVPTDKNDYLKIKLKWPNDDCSRIPKRELNSNSGTFRSDSSSTLTNAEVYSDVPQLASKYSSKEYCVDGTNKKNEKKKYEVRSTKASRAREEMNRRREWDKFQVQNQNPRIQCTIPALRIPLRRKSYSVLLPPVSSSNVSERQIKSIGREPSSIPISMSSALKLQSKKKSHTFEEIKTAARNSLPSNLIIENQDGTKGNINNHKSSNNTIPGDSSKGNSNEYYIDLPANPKYFQTETNAGKEVQNTYPKFNQNQPRQSSLSKSQRTQSMMSNIGHQYLPGVDSVCQPDANYRTDSSTKKLPIDREEMRDNIVEKSNHDWNNREIQRTNITEVVNKVEKNVGNDINKAIDERKNAAVESEIWSKSDVILDNTTMSLVETLKERLFQANNANKKLKKQLNEVVDELTNTKIKLKIAESTVDNLKIQQQTQLVSLSNRVAEVDQLMSSAVSERELWRERATLLEDSLNRKIRTKEKKRDNESKQCGEMLLPGVSGDSKQEKDRDVRCETPIQDKKQRTVVKILKTVKKVKLTPEMYNKISLKQQKAI